MNKTASGAIYIQSELSDARLQCEELKTYLVKTLNLINSSSHKDHFYAVAGDIIVGAPVSLVKLEKALAATAMAVDKLDYEELRQTLNPVKVDQLERMLEELRIRIPRRTG